MKSKIKYILTALTFIVLATSCSEVTPASFWLSFHNNLISVKNSDQGPWGGEREITWENKTDTFDIAEIVQFAKENDWNFVDSTSYSNDTLTKNSFIELKADEHSLEILNNRVLPSVKSKNNTIIIFKTNWVLHPGHDVNETLENGFAILNLEKTNLKIYHFWGE